jgi:dihydrofolate reductase
MRKVTLFMTLSLDGYFEGPHHDISWHHVDDEFNKFAIEEMKQADLILFGRRTYQLMEGFWPNAAKDPTISKENLEVANLMNNTNKIVFSRTLVQVEEKENWKNVKLFRKFDVDEIKSLKGQSGKDISIGGSELAVSFIKAGLIDELKFMINPVVIGNGTPLFKGIDSKQDLELIKTRIFESGNVLLCYKPSRD